MPPPWAGRLLSAPFHSRKDSISKKRQSGASCSSTRTPDGLSPRFLFAQVPGGSVHGLRARHLQTGELLGTTPNKHVQRQNSASPVNFHQNISTFRKVMAGLILLNSIWKHLLISFTIILFQIMLANIYVARAMLSGTRLALWLY